MSNNIVYDKLVAIVGQGNVLSHECDLITYTSDHLPINPLEKFAHKPDFVVKPKTSKQILEIIQLANQLKFPVVPRGAGTGMCGGVVPLKGGVLIDMMSMNKILEIDEENMTVKTEVGVGLETLEEELAKHGFLLGHMPASRHAATVGGAISTSGSGYLADRYGRMADMVLGLQVVVPYGEIIQVGGKYGKSSSGYDLKRLFIGALGTLGVVTKATLRINPIPEFSAMCALGFSDFTKALNASYKVVRRGLRPTFNHVCDEAYVRSWGEDMDDSSIADSLKGLAALMYLRFEGIKEEVLAQEDEALKICKTEGGIELNRKLAQIRWDNLLKGFYATTEDSTFWTADIGVPSSKVAEVHDSVRKVIEKYKLAYMGARWASTKDGEFPFSYLFDKRDPQGWENFRKAEEEIANIAIDAGGTMSEAHGIGNRPLKHLMEKEHGLALDTMKKIKKALDPNNIMNPGLIE